MQTVLMYTDVYMLYIVMQGSYDRKMHDNKMVHDMI